MNGWQWVGADTTSSVSYSSDPVTIKGDGVVVIDLEQYRRRKYFAQLRVALDAKTYSPQFLANAFGLALVMEHDHPFTCNFVGEISDEDKAHMELYRLVGTEFKFYRQWIDGKGIE